ncbi:DUF2585 domain-containing protein [Aureimonas fodinaquatilis]|uniref:UPF0314 protein FPY71_03665 n=1 Tax=Aureimonas fodinaquatilis TaxID=2565783 RepID=A0A5B0E0R1_9HYPH|nr:DUF2585 domain-containing protein [Aureimonas fodinaquatilis]KAA0972218.1 DUF2585 domain-containing protein [Aureimonas fodinaquatilis]
MTGTTSSRIGPLWWLVVLTIVLLMAATLLAMGRVPICECGTIKLWHGAVVSSENSQHISDWYSPSHFIHGLLFYWVTWLLLRQKSMGLRLAIATAVEALWEIVENTDMVINRYREATIALDYFGDSVLNSVSDAGFMIIGFLFASRMPVAVSVGIAVFFELLTAYIIRDNLTLNIIMLIWPMDWIRVWQGG